MDLSVGSMLRQVPHQPEDEEAHHLTGLEVVSRVWVDIPKGPKTQIIRV